MDSEDIESKLNTFETGAILNLTTPIEDMKKSHEMGFAKSSIFKESLDEILKQSEF